MTERASGWYDDPNDATLLRYWDGILWSDRTMPKLMPGLEHVGEARPAPPVVEDTTGDGRPMFIPSGVSGPSGASPAGGSAQHQQGWQRQGESPLQTYQGPQYVGRDDRRQAFGNTIGMPSGVGRRIVAAFLDEMIVGVPVVLAMLPFMSSWLDDFRDFYDRAGSAAANGEQMPDIPSSLTTPPLALALGLLVATFVYDAVMTAVVGATVGKKALGIRVAPQEAEPLDRARLPWGRSIVRAGIKTLPDVMGLVSLFAAFGGVLQIAIILWALSNPLRQGLDDLAAKSVVRRVR